MSRRKSCIAFRLPLRLLVGVYFLSIPAALADDAAGGCAQNRALDTAHYVDALKGDARNLGAAIFQQVPSDLTMAPESGGYVVRGDAAMQALPLANAPAMSTIHSGGHFTASCRVKGPAGDWWLVVRTKETALAYVAENKTQRADEGNRLEDKPEPHVRDPNLSGKY